MLPEASSTVNDYRTRTLVVDDEPLARSNLMALLQSDPNIELLGECGGGRDAVSTIRRSKPDLVFLDVEMPEWDGFDVLEQLGADVPPAIIFVTAYDQYAIRAFEAGALDYLLKPFDDVRFGRALVRARERIARLNQSPEKSDRLVIKGTGQVSFVKLSEIDWIEAADYYVSIHVGTKTHLLRRSMADLEQELDGSLFCRIHRSSIVNIDRVQGLKLNRHGDYDVLLVTGQAIRLSRRYRKEVQSRLRMLRR